MEVLKPKAYSYIRFSTPEQAKGGSLDRQIKLSNEFAAKHGLHLDDTLTFKDLGTSAYDQSNLAQGGKLAEFLSLVRAKKVPRGSYLLIESLDRLSRATISVALRLLLELMDEGIIVITLIDGQRYEQTNTAADFQQLLVSLSIFFRANDESRTKSERGQQSWVRKRTNIGDRKLTKLCPAWMRLSSDATSYELIPEHAAVVREIIRLTQEGMGRGSIARRFNEAGIRTIAPKRRQRDPGSTKPDKTNPDLIWHESYIAKMLANRALIGEFQPHRVERAPNTPGRGRRVPEGLPIPDYFPALIDEDAFELLQAEVKGRGKTSGGRRGATFSNLFTGLVRCMYCRRPMVYVNKGEDSRGNRDNRRNKFLVCSTAQRGNGCHKIPWIYHEFEAAFFAFASKADFSDFVAHSNDRKAELRTIRDEITVLEAAIKSNAGTQQRATDLMLLPNATNAKALLDRVIALQEEEKSLKARHDDLHTRLIYEEQKTVRADETLAALQYVREELKTKTGEDAFPYRARLNQHLRRILDAIMLAPGGTWFSKETIDLIRDRMKKVSSLSAEEIEFYCSSMSNRPLLENRTFSIVSRTKVLHAVNPATRVEFGDALNDMLQSMDATIATTTSAGRDVRGPGS